MYGSNSLKFELLNNYKVIKNKEFKRIITCVTMIMSTNTFS